MRCQTAPGTSGALARASCTRFSPRTRSPQATASRIRSTPTVLVTATSSTLSGRRPLRPAASAILARTRATLAPISAMNEADFIRQGGDHVLARAARVRTCLPAETDAGSHASGDAISPVGKEEVGPAGRAVRHDRDMVRGEAEIDQQPPDGGQQAEVPPARPGQPRRAGPPC